MNDGVTSSKSSRVASKGGNTGGGDLQRRLDAVCILPHTMLYATLVRDSPEDSLMCR